MKKKITTTREDIDYLHPALCIPKGALVLNPFGKRTQQGIGLSKAEQEVWDALQALNRNGGRRKKKKRK